MTKKEITSIEDFKNLEKIENSTELIIDYEMLFALKGIDENVVINNEMIAYKEKFTLPQVKNLTIKDLLIYPKPKEILRSILKNHKNITHLIIHERYQYGEHGYSMFKEFEEYTKKYLKEVKNNLKIWSIVYFFEDLITEFKQLETISFYIYTTQIHVSRSNTNVKPNITSLQYTGYLKLPHFLEELTSLEKLEITESKFNDIVVKIVNNNPNLQTLICSETISSTIFEKDIPNIIITGKLSNKYNGVFEEIKELSDKKKNIIARFLIAQQTVPFKPKIETLFVFLTSNFSGIRKEALKCFDKYFNANSISINNQKIWLSGTLQLYKVTDAKNKIEEKGSTLTKKRTKDTTLLVIGLNPKIIELPADIPVISSILFEKLLLEKESTNLEKNDNQNFVKKLTDLLLSDDNTNVEVALKLMKEGGIPKNILSLLFGIYKVHSNKKIESEISKLIKLRGGEIGTQLMNISKRNFRSMYLDHSPKKEIDKMLEIKGFEIEPFAYIITSYLNIGSFALTHSNSKWAKLYILNKYSDEEEITIYTKPSKYFSQLTKLKKITVKYIPENTSDLEPLFNLPNLKQINLELNKNVIFPNITSSSIERIELVTTRRTTLPIETLKVPNLKYFEVTGFTAFHFSGSGNFKANSLYFAETKMSYDEKIIFNCVDLKMKHDDFNLNNNNFPNLKTLVKSTYYNQFKLPKSSLKIKKLTLEKMHILVEDSSFNYFPHLEELILDNTIVSDMSIFKVPTLKKITILSDLKSLEYVKIVTPNIKYLSLTVLKLNLNGNLKQATKLENVKLIVKRLTISKPLEVDHITSVNIDTDILIIETDELIKGKTKLKNVFRNDLDKEIYLNKGLLKDMLVLKAFKIRKISVSKSKDITDEMKTQLALDFPKVQWVFKK